MIARTRSGWLPHWFWALTPVALLLAACPPIPIVELFNATELEATIVVGEGADAREVKVLPGHSRRQRVWAIAEPLHVRAAGCDYSYDLAPAVAKRKTGTLYEVQLKPDHTLRVIAPGLAGGRVRAKSQAFETVGLKILPLDVVCR